MPPNLQSRLRRGRLSFRRSAISESAEMKTETLEFKFPDGDFEVDTVAQIPRFGEVVTKRGRVWKVDDVLPGTPPVALLRPVSPTSSASEDP